MEEVTSNILPDYILCRGTPSSLDGVQSDTEKLHRAFGCELIVQCGSILNLPHVVVVTGQNILNRFFYRKSLKRFDAFTVAMGSVLLASKVEESFKTLREFLFAFHYLYAQRKCLHIRAMELGGQQYAIWKNELVMIERFILKELGFSLYNIMDHPHKYILYFVKVLNGSEELANVAWSYLNDSMRLDISLRYESTAIACAAIFLGARKIGFPLPESVNGREWWRVMGGGLEAGTARDAQIALLKICDEILSIYEMEKIGWLEPIADVEFLSPPLSTQFDSELLLSADSSAHADASTSKARELLPPPVAADLPGAGPAVVIADRVIEGGATPDAMEVGVDTASPGSRDDSNTTHNHHHHHNSYKVDYTGKDISRSRKRDSTVTNDNDGHSNDKDDNDGNDDTRTARSRRRDGSSSSGGSGGSRSADRSNRGDDRNSTYRRGNSSLSRGRGRGRGTGRDDDDDDEDGHYSTGTGTGSDRHRRRSRSRDARSDNRHSRRRRSSSRNSRRYYDSRDTQKSSRDSRSDHRRSPTGSRERTGKDSRVGTGTGASSYSSNNNNNNANKRRRDDDGYGDFQSSRRRGDSRDRSRYRS